MRQSSWLLPAGLALALAATTLFALGSGSFPLSLSDVLRLLAERLGGAPADLPPMADTVLWQIRGPRVLAAVLVGAGLAASGVALQSVFRNPLAAPDLLGVSAGSAVGAVLGIFLGWTAWAIQGAAFAGGLAAVAVVYAVGSAVPLRDRTLSLVLVGIAVGSMLGSVVALIKTLADPYTQLPAITFWLLGSFASIGMADLLGLAACGLLGLLPLLLMRWRADALMLSDDEVRALGIRLQALRLALVVGATLLTAATVAAAGIIGWIGLVVPHAARLLVGASFARLLPVSMLLGALLMLAIDTLGRNVGQAELPPGVLTALIGAPVLFFLMLRRRDD
ncbi:iron ABC transporter permease [Burkholderiaceae bacterium FT117]|uniref:FecCD family ABC transporter permease n=1 Tax=Zeimonas sediminis TaxID=2944268 RepID=UPI002342BDB1|nr:iron ABC transporter permease [Zeimonas sediminis]MCM5569683.1 iron ABC transporter permease [Zeimonas sediminis]